MSNVPYRIWFQFSTAGFDGYSTTNQFEVIDGWTTTHHDHPWLGRHIAAGNYYYYNGIFRPQDSFSLETSMDAPVDAGVRIVFSKEYATGTLTDCDFKIGLIDTPADPGTWDVNLCNGKYYDGTNSWGDWPPGEPHSSSTKLDVTFATDIVIDEEFWTAAYTVAGGLIIYSFKEELFNNGFGSITFNYTGTGNYRYSVDPKHFTVRYHNPIVNSISRQYVSTAGGDTVMLTGLGFNIPDADLTDTTKYILNATPPGGWDSIVDTIYLIGQQGQGTTTLTSAGGDFTVDSNTQITITSPALTQGTYEIRLKKHGVANGAIDVYSYAGDYKCDDDGRVYPGSGRMTLWATDTFINPTRRRNTSITGDGDSAGAIGLLRKKKGFLYLTKWTFINAAGTATYKYYAPIDVMATEVFYDGRILSVSPLTISIDDSTGLFTISDMSIDLSNSDMEFSELLAANFIKNQIVEIYYAWTDEPESWKTSVAKMVVDDYTLKGPVFSVQLKDITQKYFKKRVPIEVITSTDYANARDDAVGKGMPDILGLCASTGENKGAIQAYCKDTTTFEYIASRGSLYSVDNVYSAGVAKTGGGVDYDITYDSEGRTIIDFTADQGDNEITFNCKGCVYEDWNSTNNYVQNPAYVIAFFFAFILEVPVDYLNLESFDDLATIFENMGVEETGKLIIQDVSVADEVLKELLFTYGVNCYIDEDGKIAVERKDISNFSTNLVLFDTVDCLDFPNRPFNLNSAINYIKARYDYIPCHSLYKATAEDQSDPSIDDYGAKMESSSEWDFPWTTSSTLITQRLQELLYRHAYGDKKVDISIPIIWLEELYLLDNFRLNDVFGLSTTGAGESGRYYYIESMAIDFDNGKIDISAIDLQWLLRSYFILGDEDSIPTNWSSTTEASRLYGYLCDEDTGLFADGEPGKILIDENSLEG